MIVELIIQEVVKSEYLSLAFKSEMGKWMTESLKEKKKVIRSR